MPLFRAALPGDLPLVAAGNIWTLADAEAALARGAAAVAIGKAAIANPDWVERVRPTGDRVRAPGDDVRRPPLTIPELRARGLNATFAANMRNWKGFVLD